MQATINSNVVKQENISEKLDFLLGQADLSTKNDVENSIVAMGGRVVKFLIERLITLKGLQRGIVAMSLIRIGKSSVAPLRQFAVENIEYRWMADYLLSEM